MKNVKLLAAAGMLSLVSFASFAQPVSVTADTLDNAEAKIAAIAKTRASLTTLPKRIPVTRFI
ncbi:Uncharacterised protein [Klebsiella michiganensis]|uniref:Uncharacterized protein n=1 Tax=Klebsiella michiganensis TaxID=1134687 RepID=A0A7H4M6P2_9ENTR|nr:Uncharacterised protein [Klebsiella michiganensis]